MNKGLNAVTYKGIAFQISYDICYPNCDLSPLKIGSIDITKNADLIVQYQSLPQELLSITFTKTSRILCGDPWHLPPQPLQINLKCFHSKNIPVK